MTEKKPAGSSIAAAGDPSRTRVDLQVPVSTDGLDLADADEPLAKTRKVSMPEIDTHGLDLAAADSGPLSRRELAPRPDIDTAGPGVEQLGSDDRDA